MRYAYTFLRPSLLQKKHLFSRNFFRSMYTPNVNLEKSRDTLTRILVYEKLIVRVIFFVPRIRLTQILKNPEIP